MKFNIFLGSLIALALGTVAQAQTKISGTVKCDPPNPQHALDVGDRPNHVFSISKIACKWTKPLEIAGVQSTDGAGTAFGEITGNKSTERGYFVSNMANADKFYVRYQDTAVLKDGAPQSVDGTWTFTGGTGKFKGLKGKGTHKGKGGADGAVTFEIEGEYTLPK